MPSTDGPWNTIAILRWSVGTPHTASVLSSEPAMLRPGTSPPGESAACVASTTARYVRVATGGTATPGMSTAPSAAGMAGACGAAHSARAGAAARAASAGTTANARTASFRSGIFRSMDMVASPGPRRIIGPTPAGPKRDPPAGSEARVPVLEQLHERGEGLVHGRGHAQLRATAGHVAVQRGDLGALAARQILRRRRRRVGHGRGERARRGDRVDV